MKQPRQVAPRAPDIHPSERKSHTAEVRVVARNNRPYNNALHQTGREGAAGFLRRRPVVEARPAGERECWTGLCAGDPIRPKTKGPEPFLRR